MANRTIPQAEARINFRELTHDDLAMCLTWRNDPEVAETLSTLTVSETELELWFRHNDRSENARFFAIEYQDELIGYVGLREIDWSDRRGVLDITIGRKDLWGHGFGTEATRAIVRFGFDQLGLERIDLTVLPFNQRGIRCYEKCGFKHVGVANQRFRRRDRVWQPLQMSVTPMQFNLALKVDPDGD